MKIIGLDITAKWRQARIIKNLIQSEIWYRSEKDAQNNKNEQAGLYFFNELSTGQQTTVGYRLDIYKDLTKLNSITQKKVNNVSYGAILQGTYISSEFAKIRATFSHEFDREEGSTLNKDTRFALQVFFIIGSHPAHDF